MQHSCPENKLSGQRQLPQLGTEAGRVYDHICNTHQLYVTRFESYKQVEDKKLDNGKSYNLDEGIDNFRGGRSWKGFKQLHVKSARRQDKREKTRCPGEGVGAGYISSKGGINTS